MFVVGNFISTVAFLVDKLLWIYGWIIIIRALISWFNPDPFNPLVQFLQRITEPVLEPIRRFMPPLGIDISPLIAVLLVGALQRFLVPTLYEVALRLQA